MRKRRRRGPCFIVRTCILMMLSFTFLLYFTSNTGYEGEKGIYDSEEWNEYFRRVQQITKRPSPEILEKLKEGMSRLGTNHEQVPYFKFAESKIRKMVRNQTTDDGRGVQGFLKTYKNEEISRKRKHKQNEDLFSKDRKRHDGNGQGTKQNESKTDGILPSDEGAHQINLESDKIVQSNILPQKYVTRYETLEKLGVSDEDVREVYEIAANQNRQYLQLDKRTFPSATQDVGNPAEILNEDGALTGALKRTKKSVEEAPSHRISRVDTADDDFNNISARLQKLVSSDFENIKLHSSPMLGIDQLVIDDRLFWSDFVEAHLQTGLSDDDISEWSYKARHQVVTEMKSPDWKTCGRPKNQLVIMKDGSRMCARYRHPHNELVQGEIYSFYLASLLGIRHVPAVVLSMVNSTSPQWHRQTQRIKEAKWEEGTLVALTQWIHNLDRGRLPRIFRQDSEILSSKNKMLQELSIQEILEIMQWTDLIIFDYITGNYDRIASNQDAAEKEDNPEIMSDNIHNLRKDKQTNTIWFIDNESGFFDGYELMRNPMQSHEAKRFVFFHRQMLDSICIFRKSTVANLEKLHFHGNPAEVLRSEVRKQEPLSKFLPKIPKKLKFDQTMKRRIADVYRRVQFCKHRFT